VIEKFQFIDDLPWFTEFKSVISHRDAAKLPEGNHPIFYGDISFDVLEWIAMLWKQCVLYYLMTIPWGILWYANHQTNPHINHIPWQVNVILSYLSISPLKPWFYHGQSINLLRSEENKVQMTAEDFWALCVTGDDEWRQCGSTRMGAPKIAKLLYKWFNMVSL